jgi:hypothetical protein
VWDAEQCVMALAAKMTANQRRNPHKRSAAHAQKHDTLQSN